jgi:hypothetical protein
MDEGSPQQLGVDRHQALALGGTSSGSAFPGFGDRVVGLSQPDWDGRPAGWEIDKSVQGGGGLKSGLDSSQLEDNYYKFQGVDVNIASRAGLDFPDTMEDARTPGDVKPESEARTVGPTTDKAGVAPRPKVRVTWDNHSQRDFPRGLGRLNVGEELVHCF